MTCRGRIRQGTIVLEEKIGLPEGTEVEVELHPVNGKKMDLQQLERLAAAIGYEYDSLDTLREKSKL